MNAEDAFDAKRIERIEGHVGLLESRIVAFEGRVEALWSERSNKEMM